MHAFRATAPRRRGVALLAATFALLCALAWQAQASWATYGKVSVVKVNYGGNPSDTFTFDYNLGPSPGPGTGSFTIAGGQKSPTYKVECNVPASGAYCYTPALNVTERPTPGYTFTGAVCRSTNAHSSSYVEPTTSSPVDSDTKVDPQSRRIDFKVSLYEWVKCWVTNTRDTGTVTITKHVVPAQGTTDTGKFDLTLDGTVKAQDVGDGGSTGALTVPTGDHTVGELAGTGTSLDDYDSSISCDDGNGTVSGASISVTKGSTWSCVITNARKFTPASPVVTPSPSATQTQSPAPAIQVLSETKTSPKPGTAKLRGPSGCPIRATTASVTGKRIAKVTFYLDGRKVRTVAHPDSHGRWNLRVTTRTLPYGRHRLRVVVTFKSGTTTKRKTLSMSFTRCHAAVVTPQFTG